MIKTCSRLEVSRHPWRRKDVMSVKLSVSSWLLFGKPELLVTVHVS
jgi:hypothetical protein